MSTALFNRLRRLLDTSVAGDVMGHQAQWRVPRRSWGEEIDDVRGFVVHETSGWPARARVERFQERYWRGWNAPQMVANPNPPPPQIPQMVANPNPPPPQIPLQIHHNPDGIGTQWYISGDGTVFQLIDLPRRTFHATVVNSNSLGCETAHGQGHGRGSIPPPGHLWRPLNGVANAANAAYDDVLGAKLWWRHDSFNEMVVSWWTTARFAGPQRDRVAEPEMLFPEQQYRSWALLARYAAEHFLIPRNFPVLPHKLGDPAPDLLTDWRLFRRIVRADEAVSRSLAAFGWTQAQFDDDAQFEQLYPAGVAAGVNRHWRTFFERYRGFHGHGFCGQDNHDCPGPLFDWHRMAREVWDWWWHPFDFNAARTATNVPRRAYSNDWNGNTPLPEHYFSTPATVYSGRQVPGIHGNTGSPRTYRLEQGSPIYSLANGELVAARFPPETGGVNLAFVVVRHEVFHLRHPLAGQPMLPMPIVFPDRLDYEREPSSVYSMYMHLGRPDGMSFDAVARGNPDWLNRLLIRKKECEVGVRFHAQNAALVPQAAWNSRPPGDLAGQRARRPTVLEAWREDEANYARMLNLLRTGQLMLAARDYWVTPIKVLLGDFLGNAGVIRRDAAGTQHGVRVEVFSPNVISPDFSFSASNAANGWNPVLPPAGVGGPAVRYPSEWSRVPQGAERAALEAQGVDGDLVGWWPGLEASTQLSPLIPADAVLPSHGECVHYDPASFTFWLNHKTWRSEWPKYRAAGGAPAAPLPRA